MNLLWWFSVLSGRRLGVVIERTALVGDIGTSARFDGVVASNVLAIETAASRARYSAMVVSRSLSGHITSHPY